MRPRRSVSAPVDDSLFHVGQRLDALAADDDHAVFSHFSRVASPAHRNRSRTTTRRRRRAPIVVRLLGLSGFYARSAFLVAVAFAFSAFAVVATSTAMKSTPSSLQNPSLNTETAHEFASLSAGAALGSVLGGSLADHYGRRVILLVATAIGVVAQVLAGAVAWTHAALLAARVLEGIALGGQLVLFPIVLGELAAQRRRGRVIVVALAGTPLGALIAIHTASHLAKSLGWRVFTAAFLGGAQLVVLLLLIWRLRDSPRFLAAIGRVESALTLVEDVERAHGVDRNARVPMPSSLFEPPANETPFGDNFSTPTPIPTLPAPRRRRTSAALTPRMVSLGASLRKRWKRILFCAPYARRSLGLTILWVGVAGGLSTTIGAASRFTRGVGSPLLSTYVTAAGALGLLTSAVIVDRCGRIPLFLLSLLVSALATTLVGMHLYLSLRATALLSIASALLALASVVALGGAVLWTLESYGVLIRATGMGLAFVGMGVGVGCGQWLAWSQWLSGSSVPYVLWGVAGLFLLLAIGTWLVGTETRGLEDVDAVIMPEPSAALASSQFSQFDRDSGDKPLPLQRRVTYHSKDTTQDHYDDQDQIDTNESRLYWNGRTRVALPTGASATSDATTYMGSAGSSARFLSGGRLSSQRALSSRTLSLTRQQRISSHRRRDGSMSRSRLGDGTPVLGARSSLTRGDQTPPFVIRRSSLSRSPTLSGGVYAHAHTPSPVLPRARRRSRLNSGPHEPSFDHQRRRIPTEHPSSFGSTRFSLSDLTTSLHLDPHSVREHLGRRSSLADRSSSSSSSSSRSVDLGIAPEHDVMTIDIDPFEDDNHTHTLPILG